MENVCFTPFCPGPYILNYINTFSLQVGRGSIHGHNVLLTYQDTNPLAVRDLGVLTSGPDDAQWIFTDSLRKLTTFTHQGLYFTENIAKSISNTEMFRVLIQYWECRIHASVNWSTLVQVMACATCPPPSHYLYHCCWLIINWSLRNKLIIKIQTFPFTT